MHDTHSDRASTHTETELLQRKQLINLLYMLTAHVGDACHLQRAHGHGFAETGGMQSPALLRATAWSAGNDGTLSPLQGVVGLVSGILCHACAPQAAHTCEAAALALHTSCLHQDCRSRCVVRRVIWKMIKEKVCGQAMPCMQHPSAGSMQQAGSRAPLGLCTRQPALARACDG